ncbi:argininosuccinate lyase [Verrucomicrobiota bacterium]
MKKTKKIRETIVGNVDSEVLQFTVGKDPVLDITLAEADCIGTAAHVTMLSRIPIKPPLFTVQGRKRVIRELIAVMRKARRGLAVIEEKDQDIHLAVERIMTQKLGDPGKRIHTARSRNDQVAVDLRLYGKEQLFGVMDEALGLAKAMLNLAQRHEFLPMVGRTHMQPAMPSSVGLWASAHAESILDDINLLKGAYEYNDRCPLGSAAGYGVQLKIDRPLTARLLGFREPIHNVLYASNARGKCESVILSALSQVMLSLSRLAQDIILYTMPEFSYFSLPAEYCTGSSIMPQKNNPDVLELVRAKAVKVLTNASATALIVSGLPSGYSRDLQEIKEPFIDGIQTTRSCLRISAKLIGKLKVNRKALLTGFTSQVFAADVVLDRISEGVSFREAYNYVKKHLADLDQCDPVKAIKRKTHSGAAGRLNLDAFKRRVVKAENSVEKERRKYFACITKLLGAKYPLTRSR